MLTKFVPLFVRALSISYFYISKDKNNWKLQITSYKTLVTQQILHLTKRHKW